MRQLRLPVLHNSLQCVPALELLLLHIHGTWYLTEQLQKAAAVNEANKDYVVETLRSIAELLIWGDQNDNPALFDFFMEKQVMSDFIQILKNTSDSSNTIAVQLLQTLSLLIQNIRSEQAIYYLFSNEYINKLITYPFDFRHEELLAYYISFLRTISMKLDKNTISFFIKTEDDEIVSFPLYTEAIKFFHHEESMVRIAVRTLTLSVYHVDDDGIRKFVTSSHAVRYFSDVVEFVRQQSFALDGLVAEAAKSPDSAHTTGRLEAAIAETGDLLYYCNDIIGGSVPGLAEIMTEHILRLLVVPVLIPSIYGVQKIQTSDLVSALSAMYLLSRLLHVVRHKALVNRIAAALVRPFVGLEPALLEDGKVDARSTKDEDVITEADKEQGSSLMDENCRDDGNLLGEVKINPREALISNLLSGDDKLVLAAICVFVSLLRNEALDESLLDALGLLSQRKRHRKRLLQALMGTKPDEELGQLFDRTEDDLSLELQTLKVSAAEDVVVVDSLMQVHCRRPPPCVEALWHTGWLIRQLVPHHDHKLSDARKLMLENACDGACEDLLKELKGCWCDIIPTLLKDEWVVAKKALETPSLERDSSFVLMPHSQGSPVDDDQSSSALGERMRANLKVFVVLHQMRSILLNGRVEDQPMLGEVDNLSRGPRPYNSSVVPQLVKSGNELELISWNAMPCRVSFEKGKERNVYLLALSHGVSGWLILAEDVPSKPRIGIIRVIAPLAGCAPRIDKEHPRWLHLRIRSPNHPSAEAGKLGTLVGGSAQMKRLVDGRWTLAFSDEASCRKALQVVTEELAFQKHAVDQVVRPLLSNQSPSPPPEATLIASASG